MKSDQMVITVMVVMVDVMVASSSNILLKGDACRMDIELGMKIYRKKLH